MIRSDRFASGHVGNGAGYFQDPVVGTGAEVEIGHGVFEELVPPVVKAAMLLELGVTHARVAGCFPCSGEAVVLDVAGLQDTFADHGGGLRWNRVGEFLVLDCRSLHMQVDPIEERSRDLPAVALHLAWGAAAFPFGIAIVAAGTGIHGGDEHEGRGKGHCSGGAGNRYLAILKRLSHHLKGGAVELRQFVQEEDAVMGQAHLAWGDVCGASEKADIGDRVVRVAEGAALHDSLPRGKEAADGMDLRRLDRLLK